MDNDASESRPTAAVTRSPYCVNLKDISGQRFGHLTVLRRQGKNISGQATWLCQCDCPAKNTTIQAGSTLRNGTVVSCGCFGKEARRLACTSHGLSHSQIYSHHRTMMWRTCAKSEDAPNYFDRGITVCERWKSVVNFTEDMLPKLEEAKAKCPGERLTLERGDTNGNYCPENCFFATMKVQSNNKRNNRVIPYNGEKKTMTQWAEQIGISVPALKSRLDHGWDIHDALTRPLQFHTPSS